MTLSGNYSAGCRDPHLDAEVTKERNDYEEILMPQSPTEPSLLECSIQLDFFAGALTWTISNCTRQGNAIIVKPERTRTRVRFTTDIMFTSNGNTYRVEASSIAGQTETAWAPSATQTLHSPETVRPATAPYKLEGALRLRVFGPLDASGESTQQAEVVEPPTTIVFEDIMGE
ncbi:MAG: hypothetical protein KDK70_00510 [Myxococcales bacterium]|nr:hypothetical protein [Myxococcales bacterium]